MRNERGIAIGERVRFRFSAFRVTLSEPYVERSGVGVVVDDADYTVWPCPGYALRVTESPDYPSGTIVKIAGHNLFRIGGAS